jgi:hypothetical protein
VNLTLVVGLGSDPVLSVARREALISADLAPPSFCIGDRAGGGRSQRRNLIARLHQYGASTTHRRVEPRWEG